MICVLCPVLGRPQAIEPMLESLARSTTSDWRLLFLCSPHDLAATNVCLHLAVFHEHVETRIVPWEAGHGDWARKINYGYDKAEGDFLLLGATDLLFHSGWDEVALAVAEETGAGVIGTNDLGNATVMRGRHSTHPLVRHLYIEEYGTVDEPGKVVHEGYQHQWVDTELVETAMARRQWAFAGDSHVEHLHPLWRGKDGLPKGKMDATYEKALSTAVFDNRLFRKRRVLWQRLHSPLAR